MQEEKVVVALVHRDEIPGKPSKYTDNDLKVIFDMVKECFDLSVDGVTNLIKPGQTVLLKPNIVGAEANPDSATITDPRILEATIKFIKESVRDVTVWVGENPFGSKGGSRAAFREGSWIGDAVRRAGVDDIIYFDEYPRVAVKVPDAKCWYEFSVPKALLDCDVYISVPKLKGHLASQVTITLKNAMGILCHEDMEKRHNTNLQQMIVDINKARKPDFAIVDAVRALAYDHSSRYPEHLISYNSLIAGRDAVAVDSVVEYLMGWDNPAKEVTTTRIAQWDGLGIADLNRIEMRGSDPKKLRKNLVTYFDEHTHAGYTGFPYEPCPIQAVFEGAEVFLGGCCLGCKSYLRMTLDSLYETGRLFGLVKSFGRLNIITGRNAYINPAMLPLPGVTLVYGDCAVDKWGDAVKDWPTRTEVISGCPPPAVALGRFFGELDKEAEKEM